MAHAEMADAAGARFDLVTMGRSSIDLYAREIGAPFVEIESFAAFVGGSPTNIAVGARRLGLRTGLLTAVGEDPVGDFVLAFLRREGVDVAAVPRKRSGRTSAVVLGIEPPDRFPLVFYRADAADALLDIDDVLASPVDRTAALEVSGTGLAREPARSATVFAVERARAAGATIYLDLDFRADQWHDPRAYGVAVRGVLPLVDVAIGTEEEVKAVLLSDPAALRIAGSQVSAPEIAGDVEAAVEALLASSWAPAVLVVKRGAEGASVHAGPDAPDLSRREALRMPGFPVEVVNVLGAGDAFAAGLIYGRTRGWDWRRSTRLGNACGAILVTRHGCADFMPTLDEVLAFVESHGGL